MMRKKIYPSYALMGALVAVLFLFTAPTSAVTLWTDWTSTVVGTPGSASGVLNGVAVSYTGEVINAVINGTTNLWAPDSSFIGGTVTTSPSTIGDIIFLNGSFTETNTITFATPVIDPLFAIWSLGKLSVPASFTFNVTPTFEAGGPNSLFDGQAITVSGNTVSGLEGNGVVQFTGTFSSLSWTDTFEDFYGFTVGLAGTPSAVPEPSTLALTGLGVLGLLSLHRVRRR